MKKRMDREQSAYQQEKALNGLFAERDFGVISREKLCRICGCKENRWGIRGALVFGGGTLAFHTLLFGIGIVCSILLIFLIFSFLTGGSLV